jgi:hypothetical protein
MNDSRKYTRRQYMTYHLVMSGTPALLAMEAISSTAIEHPDWDMDNEKYTWSEWQEKDSGDA